MNFDSPFDELTRPYLSIDVGAAAEDLTVRMAVRGEVDAATSPDLNKAIVDVLRHHRPRRIDIDCAGISFLDSTGIRALLVGRADAQQVDCRLRLLHAPPAVYRVLDIVGLLEVFQVTASTSLAAPVLAAPVPVTVKARVAADRRTLTVL